ncbi:MAG: PDZ domain-containing protein [Candidatus Eisenbacteria bacterium]|uniref:PDZ domain-containing protein n=1 Tax=Eiseniibacteriota bacterium TaxID=2212470 RepID=A0A933SB01_UNCEI|nr:PDZ domain-containing protein [Candidatus Eisenbacteria bacterium]
MRRFLVPALLLVGCLVAGPAAAKQPRCPLPLDECLQRFELMKTRPWLGVELDRDSTTGVTTIVNVTPGGPAERAGVKPGDVLEKLDGLAPDEWFAGRAGWKTSGDTPVAIVRSGRPQTLRLPVTHIPEDLLTRLVGEHMLEGHLAWMEPRGHEHSESHQR